MPLISVIQLAGLKVLYRLIKAGLVKMFWNRKNANRKNNSDSEPPQKKIEPVDLTIISDDPYLVGLIRKLNQAVESQKDLPRTEGK